MRAPVAIIALFAAILAGCTKYSAECELVVTPYVMAAQSSDPKTPAYMVRVYAYYINEEDAYNQNWRPMSYADADAGIVTHRETGQTMARGLAAGQGEDTFVHIALTRSPVLLVAVDPLNRMYGWRTFKYQMPLETIRIPVSFQKWRETEPHYKEYEWTMVGEASEQQPDPEQGE